MIENAYLIQINNGSDIKYVNLKSSDELSVCQLINLIDILPSSVHCLQYQLTHAFTVTSALRISLFQPTLDETMPTSV